MASEDHPSTGVMAGICEAMGLAHRYGAVLPGLKKR
jgi:hypothetical protein